MLPVLAITASKVCPNGTPALSTMARVRAKRLSTAERTIGPRIGTLIESRSLRYTPRSVRNATTIPPVSATMTPPMTTAQLRMASTVPIRIRVGSGSSTLNSAKMRVKAGKAKKTRMRTTPAATTRMTAG